MNLERIEELERNVERKAAKHIEENGWESSHALMNSGQLGIYKAFLHYLTDDQLDRIFDTHFKCLENEKPLKA